MVKENKPSFFVSLWRPKKEIDPTSTEDFPVSPPPTPGFDSSFGTVTDEEIGNYDSLVQELKELGIDFGDIDWKKKIEECYWKWKAFFIV